MYANPNFKRDRKDLLPNIKRKINQTLKEDRIAVYQPPNQNLMKQITELKLKQKRFEGMCKELMEQNNRILKENEMLMKKLNKEQQEKNKKIEQLLLSLILARGNSLPALEAPE